MCVVVYRGRRPPLPGGADPRGGRQPGGQATDERHRYSTHPAQGLYFVTSKIYILPLTSFRRYADIDSPGSFFVYIFFRFAHILPFYFPFSF